MPTILELNFTLICIIILFAFFIKSVELVPDDYCLTPLNRSNCGYPPTPVFQYYKSGSRCEIQFWRGCPTANLFRNEYDCSHHCIGQLWKSASNENTENDIFVNEELLKEEENPCDEDITTFKCTNRKQMIYTYDNKEKACIRKVYYGCDTRNKFSDQQKCEETCQKDKLKWNQIDDLNEKELKDINDMLEKVNEDFKTTPHHTTHHTTHDITHHKQQLKHFKPKSSTSTTAATEPPSTTVVTDKPTEVSTTSEITDKITNSTHASEITASLTEATPAIEITNDTTEATPASEITVETTKITKTTTNIVTKPQNPEPHRSSIEESDIVRSKHKLLRI